MSKHNEKQAQTEDILMALDQVEQTMEVMCSVVSRLKGQLYEQDEVKDPAEDDSISAEEFLLLFHDPNAAVH